MANGFLPRNGLFDYFLLVRPYTLPGIAIIALIAATIGSKVTLQPTQLIMDVTFAILFWSAMAYLNEAFKTQYGRLKIPFSIPIIFFLTCILISFFRNPITIIFLIFGFISTIIYFFKSKNWFGSPFVFLFRAGTELAIFFSIVFFYNNLVTTEIAITAAIIMLLTDSRNLIGDLRDVKFDKYTFPVKFGKINTKILALALLLITIYFANNLIISLPLIIMGILLILKNDGYMLHQIYVITSEFFFVNYLTALIQPNLLLITNTSYLIALLNFTYPLVPRLSNQPK